MFGVVKPMKHPRLVISSIAIAALIVTGSAVLAHSSVAPAGPDWYRIGKGNLKAELSGGKYIIHPAPAEYMDMLGISGCTKTLILTDSYEVKKTDQKLHIKKISSNTRIVNIENKFSVNILRAGKSFFSVSGSNGGILSAGEIVAGDNQSSSNIYLIDGSGRVVKLLDSKILDKNNSAGSSVKASNPISAGNGSSIVFLSNAAWDGKKVSNSSVFNVSSAGGSPKLIIDASKYKEDAAFLMAGDGNIMAYFKNNGIIAVYNLSTGELKEISFRGFPVSLSPDGETLLYKKDELAVELFSLDIGSGKITKAASVEGYFYESGGAWSPDGTKFAFYLNSDSKNDPSRAYRTNVKIGIIDAKTGSVTSYPGPNSTSTLYSNGDISWVGNGFIIANTSDDYSWAFKIPSSSVSSKTH